MRFFITLMLCLGFIPCIQAQQPDSLPAPVGAGAQPLAVSPGGSQPEISDLTWAENLASQSIENNLLIRRVNTPTDKYTGVVDVELPLYEMDNYIGKLPISLHYLTTGQRVKDASSDVGLGWELSAGGKSIRVVRGQPDDFEQLKQTCDLTSAWNNGYFEWYTRYEWDTEPDVYYFELPGLSGCFVFDGDGVAHTIPEQHIKIENSGIGTILIYAQDGTRYYMDKTSPNSWHLTQLIYPDNSVVLFEYDHYGNNTHQIVNYISTVESRPNATPRITRKEKKIDVPVLTNPVHLTSIRYNEHEIKFQYCDFYKDQFVDSSFYCLRTFEVLWKNKVHRKFHFVYDTLSRTKYKLLSIHEKMDIGKEVRPLYRFEYYADTLPRTNYLGIDHWGYCNSREQNPEVCPGIEIGDFSTVMIGASRRPDLTLTRAQSLRKVIYPGGGSKEFIYELHRGINPRTGREEDAGGLRISRIIERTSDNAVPSIRRYEYSGGEWSSDIDNYLLERRYNPQTDTHFYYLSSYPVNPTTDLYGASVVYSDVKEYLPNGSCVHYHYLPLSGLRDVLPDKYRMTDAGPVFEGKETDGRTPKSTRAWGRNLLQWRKSCDADGNVVGYEEYRYRLDTARAVRIPGYRMYSDEVKSVMNDKIVSQKKYYIGRYEWVCCNTLLNEQIVHASDTDLPRRTLYGYSLKGLLHKVFDTDAEGVLTTHTFKYACDYTKPDTVLRGLVNNNFLKPIEQVSYRRGKVWTASFNTYTLEKSILPKGVTILPAKEYKLKYAPLDSTAFRPSYTDAAGNLLHDKTAYRTVKSYEEYFWNKLCCYKDENGQCHAIVFDHREHTFPVASVMNAYHTPEVSSLNEVYFNNFEGFVSYGFETPDAHSGSKVVKGMKQLMISGLKDGDYTLTYWFRTDADPLWKRRSMQISLPKDKTFIFPDFTDDLQIDDLSIIPRNATLESSDRIGPLGILSETDAQGHVRNYRYNSVGLPIEISDEQGNILKKYTYDPKFIQL